MIHLGNLTNFIKERGKNYSRPNIIVNSESTGFIINNISDPLNINRTLISGTVNSLLIILLRHKEGHFMVGGGREKPDTLFFIRIYYLEEDNLRASLIKEIITPMNTTKYCFVTAMKEIQLGTIVYQIYCGINKVCFWNYAEAFEEERIHCVDNPSEDIKITNFLPILPD